MRIQTAEELEVCEEVGRGGFGIVYRGIIKATNEEVAIKQIDLENDQTDLLEVNKEILIISECRLPQITKYLGCFVRHFKLWVIMEFVNGGSLFDLLKPGSILDESVILIILKEILIALEYLHNQGKIHRDLKSQNILLNNHGEVKLTDFGVSTQLSSNFSCRNTTVGTPYWMAPEVILNNKGGHSYKADIWSLGCCAYELFNGKPPLQTQFPPMKALRQISRCTRNNDFTDLIGLDDLEISDTLKDFLTKCFIVDPKERFSATKLLKHNFITKNCKKINEPLQRKSLKQLITRKQLWDQDHHVLKNHKFYIPTEMMKNQEKWDKNERENNVEDKTIQFDITSINYSTSPLTPPPSNSPSSPSSTDKSMTRNLSGSLTSSSNQQDHPPSSNHQRLQSQPQQQCYKANTKQDVYKKNLQQELNKIVNKVFHRLETKNNLTTEQYDLLVSLNNNILSLASFAQYSDTNQLNKKILICQYFKYFLKEISKNTNANNNLNLNPNSISQSQDTENIRSSLQKSIIPSTFQILDTSSSSHSSTALPFPGRLRSALSKSFTEFDEIENSLFESWIDKMTHVH